MVDFGSCFGGPDNSNDSVTSNCLVNMQNWTPYNDKLKFHKWSPLCCCLLRNLGDALPSDTLVAILSWRHNRNFPHPYRQITWGHQQWKRRCLDSSYFFVLTKAKRFILSLHFIPSLQSVFYTDQRVNSRRTWLKIFLVWWTYFEALSHLRKGTWKRQLIISCIFKVWMERKMLLVCVLVQHLMSKLKYSAFALFERAFDFFLAWGLKVL